ncbi:MAG: FAD binding domain-containing protein [Phycisphaerae bacterium]
MNAFEYVTAESFAAATTFLADRPAGDTLVKAGGIDVLDRLKERLETPKRLLNLRDAMGPGNRIAEIGQHGIDIVLSATTTLAAIANHTAIRQRYPALAQAAEHAATPQIRNVATLGGNLCQKPRCWYYRSRDYDCLKKGGATCYAVHGDNRYHAIFGAGACHIVHPSSLAVPLLAYDAWLRLLKHEAGKLHQRKVSLDDFFRVPANPQQDENVLEPGELIFEVFLPFQKNLRPRSAYVELREKQSFDWPMVSCAVNLNDGAKPRVVLGAVAPIPWRLKRVEALLADQKLTDALGDKAKAVATRDANPMSLNRYKVQLAGVALERALRQADQEA